MNDRKKIILLVTVIVALVALAIWEQQQPVTISTTEAPKPIGPYSQGVFKNKTLYVSGQVGINPANNEPDTASIVAETNRVMKNIGAILNAAKMDYDNISKATIYLTDMNDFKEVNDVYASYFTDYFPARETVCVKALPKGMHIEISVIAERN